MSHWVHKQSIRNFKEEVEEEEKEVEKLVEGITNNLKSWHKKVEFEKECESKPKGHENLNVWLGK